MNSTERVIRTLRGEETDRQPIYGWVKENLSKEISEIFGSVENFEDRYEFDAAMIFGCPWSFSGPVFDRIKAENEELTPDILVDEAIFTDPCDPALYKSLEENIAHHKKRGRFCYVHTPGFFEHVNCVFGIQNHLRYMAMYPDELAELYARQAEWTMKMSKMLVDLDLGADMTLFSDDWGAQNNLMFSPTMWKEMIYPNMKKVVDNSHSLGLLTGLHSDGCILSVADGIAELGIDMVHPWQENAGMGYDIYLAKYADKFGIHGGICVQSAIGILPREELEAEIRRVFSVLRGKRWVCNTSHYVQNHCTMEDLIFAFDLIYKLAREPISK
ncbi:MAG: hypothetical protein II350_05590 [Clostridia bacterium]|nr:hypothetical protein [Clostridia bacterium]